MRPVPCDEVNHQAVVAEAYVAGKQYGTPPVDPPDQRTCLPVITRQTDPHD